MAGLVVPERLVAVSEIIEVIECIGTPELWATGSIMRDMGDHMLCLIYSDRFTGDAVQHFEVARIFMPAAGYAESFVRECKRQAGGKH